VLGIQPADDVGRPAGGESTIIGRPALRSLR